MDNFGIWSGVSVKRGSSTMQIIETIRSGNTIKKRTTIRDLNGNRIGTISETKSIKKKKKLQYNFKKVSNRILAAKSSGTARKALTTAQSVIASLRQKLRCGEYEDRDLEHAILHAESMERVARKKMKHLKEEEKAKQQAGPCEANLEEEKEPEVSDQEAEIGLSEEELRELMQELQDMLEESADWMEELAEADTLTEEIVGSVRTDMDPADLEQLKKKHRAEEMRDIVEADMKYLKALFDKLAKEKQQASESSSSHGSEQGSVSDGGGVALEIGGVDLSAEAAEAAEAASLAEGSSVDISI